MMNFMKKCALFAFRIYSLDQTNAQMAMIGGNRDVMDVLLDGGYQWCEDTTRVYGHGTPLARA